MTDKKITNNDLLEFAIQNELIDLDYVKNQIEVNRRQRIILEHPYSIWCGKNGKWYTYVNGENGKRDLKKRVTEEGIHDVIVEYFDKQQALVNGHCETKIKAETESYSFKEAYDRWIDVQTSYDISDNTLVKYESDYKRFFTGYDFAQRDIKDITSVDIELLIIENIKKYNLKEKAGKALWGYISGTFRLAVIDRKIKMEKNPCVYVDIKKFKRFYNTEEKTVEERTISNDQIQALLYQIELDHIRTPEYMPSYAIELAMLTGMRTGELAGLKWENVSFNEKIIYIRISEKYNRKKNEYYVSKTKNKKIRTFPITNEIEELLNKVKKVQETFGCYEDFVFSTSGGCAHGRTISDCIRNKCIQIGIETKCIYSIRRTFNSQLKCEGVSTTVAASLLGHTEEVNNKNYTYDISEMDYKRKIIENAGKRMINS